jgi:hypothetical protein
MRQKLRQQPFSSDFLLFYSYPQQPFLPSPDIEFRTVNVCSLKSIQNNLIGGDESGTVNSV